MKIVIVMMKMTNDDDTEPESSADAAVCRVESAVSWWRHFIEQITVYRWRWQLSSNGVDRMSDPVDS
jgi:hypothetical protein